MKLAQALADGTRRLEEAGIVGAGHDARVLMAEALGVDRAQITADRDRKLDGAEAAVFEGFLVRRLAHEPVSRILGRRLFWDRWFKISPQVLDPRPETEVLVAEALAARAVPERILDLGVGSGIIAISLLAEWNDATAVGADISPEALAVARRNAESHDAADRLTLIESDWYGAVEGAFDLIVSNPPYVAARELGGLAPEVLDHDPAVALTPGGDGLAAYRAIIAGAGAHLNPGGRLMVEIGITQGNTVAALFETAGFTKLRILPDLDGRDRVVRGVWP